MMNQHDEKMVPSLVPCGAQFGAQHLASDKILAAPVCTAKKADSKKNGDQLIAVNSSMDDRYGVSQHRVALICTKLTDQLIKYPRQDSNL
jgi:hypothetical protein